MIEPIGWSYPSGDRNITRKVISDTDRIMQPQLPKSPKKIIA